MQQPLDGPPLRVITISAKPQGLGSTTPFDIGMGSLNSVVRIPFPPQRFIFHELPEKTVDRVASEICDAYDRLDLPHPVLEEHN